MDLDRHAPGDTTRADRTPRALVVYESMFGNTEQVARGVAAGLIDAGMECRTVDVTDAQPLAAYDIDLLVLGAPTHAFSLSRPSTRADAARKGGRLRAAGTGMREWIAAMPARPSGPYLAATFDTRVTSMRRLPKAAATRAHRVLGQRGFTMLARPTGFLVTDIAGDLAPGELDRAVAWGRLVGDQARSALGAALPRR